MGCCPLLGPQVPPLRAAPLEFLQVLPERPPRVLLTRHAAVLQQRYDLLHEWADIAWPQPLPDREPIAADGLDGAGHTVGDVLRGANEGQRVEADLPGGDLPQGRGPAGHVEFGELAAEPLGRARLEGSGQRRIEVVGRQVELHQRRERGQPRLDGGGSVQRVGPLLRCLIGVGDDGLGQKEDLARLRGPPDVRIRALKAS